MKITKTMKSNRIDTPDRVTVEGVTTETDREIAEFAGYGSSYFGYTVQRFDEDAIAVVSMFKD